MFLAPQTGRFNPVEALNNIVASESEARLRLAPRDGRLFNQSRSGVLGVPWSTHPGIFDPSFGLTRHCDKHVLGHGFSG